MNAPTFKANQLPQGEVAHVVGSKDPELWHRTIPNIFKDTVYRFANRESVSVSVLVYFFYILAAMCRYHHGGAART